MDKNPDILVVLLTYNRGEKCNQVINQILKQSIPNWNLLIIDDGSENIHGEVVRTHVNKINDPRVTYIKNPVNLKVPNTINVGIDKFLAGNWEYFTWVSDDNEYYPNYLKNLYDLHGTFSHSAWKYGDRIISSEYKNFNDVSRGWKGLASYMWNRETIKTVGKYNPNYLYVSDLEFLYKTFYLIRKGIKYSDKCEMKYIIHGDADSVKNREKMLNEHQHLNQNFINYILLEN